MKPITPGNTLRIMMPKIRCVKLSLTIGMLPNKKPKITKDEIQRKPPITL